MDKKMELRELCEGIGLNREAAAVVYSMAEAQQTYEAMHSLYREDRETFYRKIADRQEPEQDLLYYYCMFACEAYGKYRKRGIEDSVFFDTFRDIALWCGEYRSETGKCGIGRYVQDWFWRGFEGSMLRLGRLEFEEMEAPEEIVGGQRYIAAGEPVISVHVPAGEPLNREACLASIRQAYERFGKKRQYFCHSWLLFPGLKDILPQQSNIFGFRELFDVVQEDYREREAEWRVFGRRFFRVADYAEDTSLRRNLKRYLLSGGTLGNGWGILKKEKV